MVKKTLSAGERLGVDYMNIKKSAGRDKGGGRNIEGGEINMGK